MGAPPADSIEEALRRVKATLDELYRPGSPRPRLPEPDHVFREHRLIPCLVTFESWLTQARADHNAHGRCGWCGPEDCWASTLARTLLGDPDAGRPTGEPRPSIRAPRRSGAVRSERLAP